MRSKLAFAVVAFGLLAPRAHAQQSFAAVVFGGQNCRILQSTGWPEARAGYWLATEPSAAGLVSTLPATRWMTQGYVDNAVWWTFKSSKDAAGLTLPASLIYVPTLSTALQVTFLSPGSPGLPAAIAAATKLGTKSGTWLRLTLSRATPSAPAAYADIVGAMTWVSAHPAAGGTFVADSSRTFAFRCQGAAK